MHHVNGEGRDGGVVYSELLGRESRGDEVARRELLNRLYPGGGPGYGRASGGTCAALRQNSSVERVRDYHRRVYREENLRVIITGRIEEADVLEVLDGRAGTEEEDKEPFEKPWQQPAPPLLESGEATVHFPGLDMEPGLLLLGWRLPLAPPMIPLTNLLTYLTKSPLSPLPVALNKPVAFHFDGESCLYLIVSHLARPEMGDIVGKVMRVLRKKRSWQAVMVREEQSRLVKRKMMLESKPHLVVATAIIRDLVLDRGTEVLQSWLNETGQSGELMQKPDSFWMEMVDELLVKAPSFVVKALPSSRVQREMVREEEERVGQRRREAGLREKQRLLEEAVRFNLRPPPPHFQLPGSPSPDLSGVNFLNVTTYTSNSTIQPEEFDLSDMPVFTEYHKIASKFVSVFTALDTSGVPSHLRMYLPLLLETLPSSPVNLPTGKVLSAMQATYKRKADVAWSSLSLGFKGSPLAPGISPHLVVLALQAEMENYSEAVAWSGRILCDTVITLQETMAAAERLATMLGRVQSGAGLVGAVMAELLYPQESNIRVAGTIGQGKFLRQLKRKLDIAPEEVLENLRQLRAQLVNPSKMAIQIAGNLPPTASPPAACSFLNSSSNVTSPPPYPTSQPTLSPPRHVAVGLPGLHTCHLEVTTPSILSSHPSLPSLLLAVHLLRPLVTSGIRSAGLAYTVALEARRSSGQLHLSLGRSADIVTAYSVASSTILGQVGAAAWEENALQQAKNSLMFELVARESTVEQAVTSAVVSSLTGSGEEPKELLMAIDNLEEEEVRLTAGMLTNLFNTSLSRTSLVCDANLLPAVVGGFANLGLHVEVLDPRAIF